MFTSSIIAGYVLLFIAIILATISYKSYKNSPSKYFLWFLWLTAMIEIIGLTRYYYYFNINNSESEGLIKLIHGFISDGLINEKYFKKITWLYNLYRMLTFPFYIFYYFLLVDGQKKRKQIFYMLILCIVVSFSDLLISWDVFISQNLMTTRIVGGFLILISASIYLMEVLKSDKLLTFHKSLPFWITFGALIFYLTTIPIFIFKDYLYNSKSYAYTIILNISNYFLYSCFIIGFILNAIEYNKNKRDIKLKT